MIAIGNANTAQLESVEVLWRNQYGVNQAQSHMFVSLTHATNTALEMITCSTIAVKRAPDQHGKCL